MLPGLSPSTSYAAVPVEETFEEKNSFDEESGGRRSYDGLLSKVRQYRFTPPSFFSSRKSLKWSKYALAIGAIVLTYAAVYVLGLKNRDVGQICLEETSVYSPALGARGSKTKLTKFNGTLGYPSEYTGPNHGDPNPDIDAAWDKWAYVKYFSVDKEDFMKLPGADPEAARLTPEYGGGYIGFLEVSHHMHCLNMLRQAVYKDYYTKEPHKAPLFSDRPFTVKIHLQHCIEILRQNILCNADVGVITHQWITQSPDPFANFNTYHKCRDIDAVDKWIHEHEIPDTPDGSDLPIPLGSKIFARPP